MFAACAVAEDPSLRGKPLIVAGDPEDRRSIVLTASYEARPLGVHTAMPLREALRLAPKAVIVPPDHALYRRYHKRLMETLRGFTPLVEEVSIDEAYLDVAGTPGLEEGVESLARHIRDKVRDACSLTVSLGVSSTRFLAKMAANLAKDRPGGIVVLGPEDASRVLGPLPIGAFHGIGKRTEERLVARGVSRISDLERVGEAGLRTFLGEVGPAFLADLHGRGSARVAAEATDAKSISHEMTFARDVVRREDLLPILLALSDQVAWRLRAERMAARTVGMRIRHRTFTDHSRQMSVPKGVFLTEELYGAAAGLLDRMPEAAFPCRLASVAASKLTPIPSERWALFPSSPSRGEALARTVDRLRRRFGQAAVMPAGVLGSPGEDLYDRALHGSSFRTRGLEKSGDGRD